MNRSRLRLLAAEYAAGLIPPAEYRERRREFIDAVTDGSIDIEREESPAAWGGEPTIPLPVAVDQLSSAPDRRWPALLGIAAGVCGLTLAVMLWPSGEQTSPAPPRAPVLPTMEVSPARSLVESFLALRDFSAEAVRAFEQDWAALAESQRDEARNAPWFASLVRAMRDEVKTQNALAALGTGAPALERARRVLELGRQLGVAEQLPDVEDEVPPAALEQETTDALAKVSAPPASPEGPATSNPRDRKAAETPKSTGAPQASPDVTTTGDERGQQDTGTAAQASAPKATPEAPAASRGAEGAVTPAQVRAPRAAPALPAAGSGETVTHTPAPLSASAATREAPAASSGRDKTLAETQTPVLPLAPRKTALAPVAGSGQTAREWLDARGDDELTLQMFAVNRLDKVEMLMRAHPELDLHVLRSSGAEPRYRVVHGVFDDAAAARSAFERMPDDVTAASGGAIVKSFAAMREDLAAASNSAPPANLEGVYTLQLLASASRSNAEALLSAFPALALQLRQVAGDRAPYRVVYGSFQTEAAARAAAAALPPTLISRTGKPLPKVVSETGTPLTR